MDRYGVKWSLNDNGVNTTLVPWVGLSKHLGFYLYGDDSLEIQRT